MAEKAAAGQYETYLQCQYYEVIVCGMQSAWETTRYILSPTSNAPIDILHSQWCKSHWPLLHREGLKWRVVMRILVHPVMKKLPHPQDGSNSGIDDIPNPKAGQQWNAPTEEFETPLNTMAYCVGMMYARLYCYCNWLSKFSLRHPLLRLTRVPSQFSLHWVGSLNSLPNCLQMMLQLTLFKALVTRGYPH